MSPWRKKRMASQRKEMENNFLDVSRGSLECDSRIMAAEGRMKMV